jgi:hypothetical protein
MVSPGSLPQEGLADQVERFRNYGMNERKTSALPCGTESSSWILFFAFAVEAIRTKTISDY